MDELIWKQDALDALDGSLIVDGKENAERVMEYLKGVNARMKAVPPVQPKRGKWIKKHWKAFRCSECNRISEYSTNFCPNCGADMRGEAE